MFNRRHYAMPLPSFQWTRPPTWHPFHQMNSSLTKYWVAGTGNLIFPTEVRRHTHTPGQLLTSRCITIHPPGIASASFIEDMTDPKPFCCKECGLGFSQKCHLTRHMHIHTKETFVCDVCTKPFSRRGKLNCHIFHKHQTIVDKGHGYPCPQCRKLFSRKFNLARHKLLHTSIEKTNTGKAVLDEMKCNARLYKEQLQLGKDVANNLQEYDDIPELSLSTTHKQALELYKQSRLQHPHHYENVTLRPWQLKDDFIHRCPRPAAGDLDCGRAREWRQNLPSELHQLLIWVPQSCGHWYCWKEKEHCPLSHQTSVRVQGHIPIQSSCLSFRGCGLWLTGGYQRWTNPTW